ncbi:MAG: ABC transporter ATP-binding protein [Verrucomicrobiota bacterium]
MNNSAIQIKNLSLDLTGKRILKKVSLDVEKGDFVSIIGPNGAGKTSLVKCVSRIHTGWSGAIEINGEDIHKLSQRELARQLSYVPQAEGRNLPFTVFEFVLMGRYPHLSPFTSISADDKAIVFQTLEKTGLGAFADRRLNTLSGGERQMVFIAAALAQGAGILLLDEPASFLDYRHQAQVVQLLGRLHREEGITIVSVSHDINMACAQSTRIMAIKDGTMIFNGTPEEVADSETLESIYETPFVLTPSPHRPLPYVSAGGAA